MAAPHIAGLIIHSHRSIDGRTMFGQYMRPIGLPINRQPLAGRGDLDDLGVDIEAGAPAEFHLVVALGDFKVAPFGERRRIAAFRPEAQVGDARWQNADEARTAPPAKHIAHRLLAL